MTEEAKQEPASDEENPEVRFVSSDVVPELAYREHRAPILAHELDSRLTGIRRICNRVVVNLSIRIAEDVDVELSMPGKFEWLIGGEIIENDNEPTIDDDSALEHTLNYEPKIEDDGKSVVCRYVMGLKTIPFFVESQDEADNRCLVQLLKSAI